MLSGPAPVRLWHAREDGEVPFAAMESTDATSSVQEHPGHVPDEQTARQLFHHLAEPVSSAPG